MTDAIHLSNNPPLVDVEALAEKHKEQLILSQAILNAEANLPTEVNSDADLEALSKHVRDARGSWKKLDDARDAEKRPYMDASTSVQNLFKARLDKLDATKKVAEARLTIYQNKIAEQERQRAAEAAQREREEAQRRAEAAARIEAAGHAEVAETVMQGAVESERTAQKLDAVATGSAADLVRTNIGGGVVTAATSLVHEIIDGEVLRQSLGPLGFYLDQPSIDKAIRAYIKAQKLAGRTPQIAGVRFYNDSKARVR